MMCNKILLIAALSVTSLAFPLSGNATKTILARAPSNLPSIASGFTPRQTQQIMDGIMDAFELASYTRTSVSSKVDPIFAKYFNTGDRALIDGVMDTILGGDPLNPPGNPLLKDITIMPDFADPKTGRMSCTDGETSAELRSWKTDNPIMVICDPEGFGHGGIGKGYNDDLSECDPSSDSCTVLAVTCPRLDPRVTYRMDTLGATILHEYTHWLKLMTSPNGPLSKETDDVEDGYGPYNTRNLDKSEASNNADSYNWYATEVLWTVLCQVDYQDPTEDDDNDPLCANQACTAVKGPES